ncbi:hypothetical protein IscW_ISCW000791 [Ixodes scapularis]|uniref:Uncharacterized protein n=1 Tax=Ixodes scapularis TaxID=6945 RepID=B7P4N5_IXOSC|nr:hypothetical protein IscW_ISCW000791 [Ixodes scapularis]|eukprot:XP_002406293.1 hypothetical protein IscW_ISCW000791 [Ixodes scapularis]
MALASSAVSRSDSRIMTVFRSKSETADATNAALLDARDKLLRTVKKERVRAGSALGAAVNHMWARGRLSAHPAALRRPYWGRVIRSAFFIAGRESLLAPWLVSAGKATHGRDTEPPHAKRTLHPSLSAELRAFAEDRLMACANPPSD